MNRYLFVLGGVLFVLLLMWSNGSTRDMQPFANTVQNTNPNVLILDGSDPYFQWAGAAALLLFGALAMLVWYMRPPPGTRYWWNGASVGNALFAALVLAAFLFGLNYFAHSGQAGTFTAIFDIMRSTPR